MAYIHIVEFYFTWLDEETLQFVATQIDLECILLSGESQRG